AQTERCVWRRRNRARVGGGHRDVGASGSCRPHRAIRRAGARADSERAVSEHRGRSRGLGRSHPRHRSLRVPGNARRRLHDAPVDGRSRQRHRRWRVADPNLPRGAAMKPPSLTLGIEEEYQIIDPQTRELKSYITEILNGDHMVLGEIKPELHQSMVEIGSRVCTTPSELRSELLRLRGLVMDLAGKSGLVIAAAGT